MKTVDILFSNSQGATTFNNIPDFIKWFINAQMPNVNITSDIPSIKGNEMQSLCQFLRFSQTVKTKVIALTQEYNQKLMQDSTPELQEALDELVSVNSGGKCLRATLVALGYISSSHHDDYYLPLATAFELFQTSILVHDDIIDNASTRRGKDTIPTAYNKKYQNPINQNNNFQSKKQNFATSMGICLGDLGFYLSSEIIATAYQDNPCLGKILSYYNNVVIKTCKGEMLDIILPFKEEYFPKDSNLESKILKIYKLKTAWYSVIGPFCLGMMLGGTDKKQIKQMEKILLDLGVAFQIKDDLLGIYGDEKKIGKSTNSDIEEYKQTILYSYTMTTEYKDELQKYYGQKMDQNTIEKVKEIFIKSGAKTYAENKMEELFNHSIEQLKQITFIDQKNLLDGFITYLKAREK